MLKNIGLFIFSSIFTATGFAQNVNSVEHKNAVYVEFGGNGIFNSINFDRLLNPQSLNNKLSLRIGAGFYKSANDSSIITTVPFEINYWPGKSNLHLELGVGYTPSFGHRTYKKDNIVYAEKDFDSNIILRAGVRYQEKDGKILLRCGLTPVIYKNYYDNGKIKIQLWGGIAVGFVF